MTIDLASRGLIINDRLEEYDGTTAVVRSEAVPAEEIEFLRWRAERWIKLRHFPKALRHSPWFCLRHGPAMIRHVFRGSSPRTWFARDPARAAFARYREQRAAERELVIQ
jgi:anaerobic magnesium-protoporphyrin IX monomethyl ester cyclase